MHHLRALEATAHCCIHYFIEDIVSVLNRPQMSPWSLTPSTLPCLCLSAGVMDRRVFYKTEVSGDG